MQQTVSSGRPAATRSTRSVGRILREHWVLALVLVIGLALRVITQLAYQPALLYIDSFRYLAQVIDLDPRGLNPIGYGLFVLKPLLPFGGLATVAAVQHLTALLMVIAVYALLVRRGSWHWLAAIATTPLLLDAYQLQIEQNIMSDQPFQLLLVALLVALAWNDRPGVPGAAAAGLLIALMIAFRLVAVTLGLPVLIYLLVVAGGWRDRDAWRRRLTTVASMLAALAIGVFCYAAYYHSWTGEWGLTSSKSGSLYGRASVVVDCANLDLTQQEKLICPREPLGQRHGPDYYVHSPKSPIVRNLAEGVPVRTVRAWTKKMTNETIKAQPFDVAWSTFVDFAKGFRWPRGDAPGDVPLSRWFFEETYPEFALNPYNPDREALPRVLRADGYDEPVVLTPLAQFLRGYQQSIGYTPGPLLGVALLAGIAGMFAPRSRRAALRAPAFLAAGAAVTLLGTAAVIEFSWRYQLPGYVLLPVAGVLGITAWRRRPAADHDPAPQPPDDGDAATERATRPADTTVPG